MNDIQKLVDYTFKSVMRDGKPIGKVDLQKRWVETYEKFSEYGILSHTSWKMKAALYEAVGCDCPYCGKPWKKYEPEVKFQNDTLVASFHYFLPACDCIPRCPFCNDVMLESVMDALEYCTRCDAKIRCSEKMAKETRYGRKVEKTIERCTGILRPRTRKMGKGWICTECGKEFELSNKSKECRGEL